MNLFILIMVAVGVITTTVAVATFALFIGTILCGKAG